MFCIKKDIIIKCCKTMNRTAVIMHLPFTMLATSNYDQLVLTFLILIN